MAKVTLQFIGTLRLIVGQPSVEVPLQPGATFREVLKQVAEQTGKDLLPHIADPKTGEILKTVTIFMDHDNLMHLKGLDTPLTDGNEVIIMRADMAGG
jgi:molybdopterin converting factor small subunit